MKKIKFLCLAILVITQFSFADDFQNVKVLSVYDGDTIKIEIPNIPAVFGNNLGVRIRGIDTPEIKGKTPCENKLAVHVRGVVETQLKNAKKVSLKDCSRDKYFRLLCNVYADDVAIKDILLKSSFAYEYHGKTKEKINWCSRLPASLK